MISTQAVLLLALVSSMALVQSVLSSPVEKRSVTDSDPEPESTLRLIPVPSGASAYHSRLAFEPSDYPNYPSSEEEAVEAARALKLLDELLLARLRTGGASSQRRYLAPGGRSNSKRAAAMGVDLPDYILHINKGRNFDFSSFREKMQKSG